MFGLCSVTINEPHHHHHHHQHEKNLALKTHQHEKSHALNTQPRHDVCLCAALWANLTLTYMLAAFLMLIASMKVKCNARTSS